MSHRESIVEYSTHQSLADDSLVRNPLKKARKMHFAGLF